MRYLVVHQGKRDEYQVAISLSQAEHEVVLITSAYPGRGVVKLSEFLPFIKPLKKLANRYTDDLRNVTVSGGLFVELFGKLIGKFFGEAAGQEFIDRSISNRALKSLKSSNFDAIVCYNYNAYRVLSNDCAIKVKKILFQCHPHPVLIRKSFAKYINSGLIPLDNREREFSYSSSYLAELISECFFADQIIVASTYTASSLELVGISSDLIKVVPYGRSQKYVTNRNSFPKRDVLNIIFVGQFVYRKGISVIFEILNSLDFEVNINFVGRGIHELNPLDGIDNPKVRAQCFWDVSQEHLISLYESADVFLFPSFVEGFAHVILESMSMGCVPVVSNAGCGPDIIDFGINGFYAEPDDIKSYLDFLEACNSKVALDQFKSAAAEKVKGQTWEKFRIEFAKAIL